MSVQSIAQFVPLARVTIAANVRTQTGLDKASLNELAESIKTHGLLQPIIVARHEEGFAVIAGQRRTLAAKLAGLTEIQAIVYDEEAAGEDLKAAQIVENLQRENLSLAETCAAVREMLAMVGKPADVSRKLNKSKTWVSKHLTPTGPSFPDAVRELMNAGKCQDLETVLLLGQIAKHSEGGPIIEKLIPMVEAGTIGRAAVANHWESLKQAAQGALDLNDEGEGEGKGEGEGEEGEGDDEPTGKATITFELSVSQAKQFEQLGGAAWLRRTLKKLAK